MRTLICVGYLTSLCDCYTINSTILIVSVSSKEYKMISFFVKKEQEGMALFELLVETYPDFHVRSIKAALKSGKIWLNSDEAYGNDMVDFRDEVRIFVPGDIVGIDLMPSIVYQDENFVIIDKPAGLLSRSDEGLPNAVDMVEAYMKKKGEYSLDARLVPYLVYPLDKYVSGLMMLTKHEDAYLFLAEALAQRRIIRHYICPVVGQSKKNEELMAYHITDKTQRRANVIRRFRKDAKPIVTRYTTIAAGNAMSLVDVRPVTNGLHQVRAHMAEAGLCVVGDDEYGNRRFNKKAGADHIALWLKSVSFEVGTYHEYEYINGQHFESQSPCFPRCVYDDGLMDGA